jgi:HPt (histidine-containing phosphotransfer) domain-containing protein
MGSQLSDGGDRDPAAVRARMLELARKFIARTGEDVVQMRAALDGGGGFELIRQLAHRACGTGGSLGLTALSDAAGELERLIDSFPEGMAPGAAERERVTAGIDAIAAYLVSGHPNV